VTHRKTGAAGGCGPAVDRRRSPGFLLSPMHDMRAATYHAKGAAAEVLRIEELALPEPDLGEVRVRVAFSGVNPSDVKSRAGLSNPAMDYPRVVPHSDGAGVIDALGPLVVSRRVGQRVWMFNAQWERAMGTAAEFVALPATLVVPLPDDVPLEVGASIGIPLLTAYHAIDACGSLLGRSVVVFGAAGSVGYYVAQLARLGGARVIAVVSGDAKARLALDAGADAAINYRSEDVAARVRELTGGQGADLIIDVDAAANARHYGAMLAFGGKIVVYGSGQAQIPLPFRPLIVGFATLYFFIVYKLPPDVLRRTLDGVGGLLRRNALKHPRCEVHPLDQIATAHEHVEQGIDAKVLIRL
jgi:NADPH:quinone reductase